MSYILRSFDVLVVGGGSAGVAAAVSAAREGQSVGLIERSSKLGGMATLACVGTVCGLYLRGPEAKLVQNHFSREFAERLSLRDRLTAANYGEGLWFLPYRPPAFERTCLDLLAEAEVELFFDSHLTSAEVSGDKIVRISARTGQVPSREFAISARSFIDTTGEASLCQLSKARMLSDSSRQAGALSFQLNGLKIEDQALFGAHVARELLRAEAENALPKPACRVSVVPGTIRTEPDDVQSALFKLALPEIMQLSASRLDSLSELYPEATKRVDQALAFLKANVEEFHAARLGWVAAELGIRTGPRPIGQHVLSEQEVLELNMPSDTVALGSWPIETWDQGRSPTLKYFKEGACYGIPARSLRADHIKNLFFAGRCISASDAAIASARVIGTCLATGSAAGKLASQA